MNKHSGDYGHPCSCVFPSNWLTAVNNVIIYDEFSKTLMMVFTMFSQFIYYPAA